MHFTTRKRHGNGAILPFLTVSWSYGPLLAWAACLLRPPDFGKVTMRIDRIWEFLQRLSPLTRSCLLTELERMESVRHRHARLCRPASQIAGRTAPGRRDRQHANVRRSIFFAPLDPLLVDGAPEHANSGRIARSSLVPIWEWISRDLLPMMARDYNDR